MKTRSLIIAMIVLLVFGLGSVAHAAIPGQPAHVAVNALEATDGLVANRGGENDQSDNEQEESEPVGTL